MAGERSWEWIEAVLETPESHWYDLGHAETREACVSEALRRTATVLREALGPDMAGWSWGKLHMLTLRHVLGGLSPLDGVLNRGPVSLGGDQNTVWATGSSRYSVQGQRITGPVYRMIIDLGDVRNSRSVLLPGQSGHPSSPHYDDQMRDWLEGAYHPMLYTRDDVEAGAQHRLRLTPG